VLDSRCTVCPETDEQQRNRLGADFFIIVIVIYCIYYKQQRAYIGLLHVATYNNALLRNFVVVSLSFFRVNFVIVKENFILVHSRYFTMATNAFLAEIILYKLVSDACTTAV